jgi:hypothetical protein
MVVGGPEDVALDPILARIASVEAEPKVAA